MSLTLQASPRLETPDRWIPREWIDNQYEQHMRAKQILTASLNRDVMEAQIAELHGSPGGLNFMAKEQRNPMLREALYESITGNFYMNYKLTQGETPMFWDDIDVTATAIGVEGLPSPVEITSGQTPVFTSMYAGSAYVRWNLSNSTLFDILGATQQRLKASLMLQESAAFLRQLIYVSGLRSQQGIAFGLLGTSAASNNSPASVPNSITGKLTIDQLAIGTANFGQRLINGPKKLLMNPGRQADLVLFNYAGPGTGGNGFFAPTMIQELLNKCNTGTFLGNDVYGDVLVPMTQNMAIDSKNSSAGTENVIGLLCGPPEYTGVKVIRTGMIMESQKDLSLYADRLAVWADLGYYSRWAKSFQRLVTI